MPRTDPSITRLSVVLEIAPALSLRSSSHNANPPGPGRQSLGDRKTGGAWHLRLRAFHGAGPGLQGRLVGEFLLTVLTSKQARIDGDDDWPANQHARPVADGGNESQTRSEGMNASTSASAAGVMPPPQALLGSSTYKWDP